MRPRTRVRLPPPPPIFLSKSAHSARFSRRLPERSPLGRALGGRCLPCPIQQPDRRIQRRRAQVHVALRCCQVLVTRQLLDGPCRRPAHREVGTEGVPQDVHPRLHLRPSLWRRSRSASAGSPVRTPRGHGARTRPVSARWPRSLRAPGPSASVCRSSAAPVPGLRPNARQPPSSSVVPRKRARGGFRMWVVGRMSTRQPRAASTARALPICAVGLPASSSTRKRSPTPEAAASWACRRPWSSRARRTMVPSSVGDIDVPDREFQPPW